MALYVAIYYSKLGKHFFLPVSSDRINLSFSNLRVTENRFSSPRIWLPDGAKQWDYTKF
jgi:hypothetical protein